MTTPVLALALCLIHVSLMAAATLAVRACVARRYPASRAAVGAAGMSCILVVTVLTYFPLPSLWPDSVTNPDSSAVRGGDVVGPTYKTAFTGTDAHTASAQQTNLADKPNVRFTLPLVWLRHLGDRLHDVTAAAKTGPHGWKDLLIAGLLCGATLGIVRLVWALRAVRALYHTSIVITDEIALTLTAALQSDCGCHRPIELRQTDQLACAATFGFRRPVILLPEGWTEWSAEELMAALAHEVAHVRRGDYAQRLVARLGEAIYCYHPLVRAAARRLVVDQEFAADRLAGSLRSQQAYLRGLARLAVRCHDSFQTEGRWSSVSIIPKSSDFLARRLEMLRTKNSATGKPVERLVSWSAAGSVLAIALAVTFLRSPAVSSEKDASAGATPIEVARRIEPSASQDPSGTDSRQEPLFAREPFDVSIIPHAEDGAFLIRLGALLQHPGVQPHVDALNQGLVAVLREWTKNPESFADLRQIEWIAGSLTGLVEPPMEKNGEAKFMFAIPRAVIRVVQSGNWQATILKHVPGSSLQTRAGQTYVQLPILPAFGPHNMWLQFPDDKTIVVHGCLTRQFPFDRDDLVANGPPAQQPYAWAGTWRAVEGGLVTLVCNNEKMKWSTLPAEKKNWPEFAAPLIEEVKYYAFGWDWTEKSQRTAVEVRGTCADQEVASLHLSASTLLARWPDLFSNQTDRENGDRILQFISSVTLQESPKGGDQHFVHASAEAALNEQEFMSAVRKMFK